MFMIRELTYLLDYTVFTVSIVALYLIAERILSTGEHSQLVTNIHTIYYILYTTYFILLTINN